mgnify:CR=1 FL=1
MKLGKAIAAAIGTAAAVGAAVYAKKRLDETQTPLKKQKSVTAWKSGGKVQYKEVIRKPVSEGEQTNILKSRIDKATRQYEQLADRNNDTESEPADNTENEQEIAPVNFTFVQSEEDGNTGVSFDRVFDHFNRLEKPFDEESKTVDNADNNIVDTITANQTAAAESVAPTEAVDETKTDVATDDEYEAAAISAVMTMQEEQESKAEQMKLEKGIMTPDPIANAVRELADIQPVTDDVSNVSVERMSVDESIFDLSASEPVEEAVKAFEEMSEQTEEQPEIAEGTAESASTLEEEFAQAMAENVTVSEPVEEAVKAFEEMSEQTEEQPEIAEETAESASTLEEEFAQAMAENVPVSEPVEEAVKAFEEIAEPVAVEIAESQAEDMLFENIDNIDDDLSDDMASVRTAESVDDAVKEFSDLIGEPEAARSMINADTEYDDDLEQTGDIPAEENSTAEEQPVIQTVPEAQTEKTRTMDFFDLPDETYAPVQTAEEKHDDNVAEVEDLFGDLLADDEPVEKKTFTDPSEVFSMFDTADAGQDDFDKYNDEKIEEENEKKKTSDAKKYIAQDIADNIASFAQLLEPLNAIKENKIRSKSGILFDWEMRIQSLIGDLPIKTYWRNNFRNYEIWTDEKCMEKAGELLAMLELVGIVRDKAKEVVIDKDTLDFYSAQSEHLNNDFHIGETVVVTRPCWRINGKPARKGEIAKKAPFAEFSRKKVSPLETMLRENSCSDGDVNIPVTEDNFCTYDRDIPYVKQAISEGFCKCAVRRMEDGGALAFFYEVIAEGENEHYSPCTLRFEVNIDKNAKVVGRFRSEKV